MAASSLNTKLDDGYLPARPQCAETIKQMFHEVDINEFEPQLVLQLCDVAYALTKEILVGARSVSEFSGKRQVDMSDVDFALNAFNENHIKDRPPKSLIAEMAAEKNAQTLPPIRQNFGLRLPNDRFCQLQPNYVYVENPSEEPAEEESRIVQNMERRQEPLGINSFDPKAVSNLLMNNADPRKRPYDDDEEEYQNPSPEVDENYD